MKVKPRVPADLADYVSHELRSPLNGIKVWAQVLVNSLDCNDDSTARRALDGIAECIEKQVQFLDALLAEGDGHSAAAPRSNSDRPEDPMAKSTQPNEQDQDRNRKAEHPQRPDPEPDTMEGPGGRREAKAEEGAKNRTTRRGER